MNHLIRTAAAAAALTLSTVAHAGINRGQDLACEYARAALEATSRQVAAELGGTLDIGAPVLLIETAGEFGIDHDSHRADTHATTSTSLSAR